MMVSEPKLFQYMRLEWNLDEDGYLLSSKKISSTCHLNNWRLMSQKKILNLLFFCVFLLEMNWNFQQIAIFHPWAKAISLLTHSAL